MAVFDLVGPGQGDVGGGADETGGPLRSQIVLGREEEGEVGRFEGRPRRQLQGGHDLITGPGIGDGIDGGGDDAGEPGQDPLHRGGGEVLTVHPQPVGRTTGEVEESGLVAVPEIARPEPPAPGPLGLGLGVGVVALEAAGPVPTRRSPRWLRRH